MPETFEFTGETTKRCIERDPSMERKETRGDLLDTIPRKKGPFFNKSEFRPPRKGWVIAPYPSSRRRSLAATLILVGSGRRSNRCARENMERLISPRSLVTRLE